MPTSRSQSKSGAKRSLDFDHDNKTSAASNNSEIIDVDLSLSYPAAAVTPSKKKKSNKRNLDDYFGAKASATKTAVTPSKAAPSTAAVVTPPDTKRSKKESPVVETQNQQQAGEDNKYIPTYLNKNVEYKRRGETLLDPVTEQVFQLVSKHYVIPDGFENSRLFGPKSGVTFEQRVVTAYANHQFKPKLLEMESSEKATVICTSCAEIGHLRDECPLLL